MASVADFIPWWFMLLFALALPLGSFFIWATAVVCLVSAKILVQKQQQLPQSSILLKSCGLLAAMALLLRAVDFTYDSLWKLPPVGLNIDSSSHVTVYVATRDFVEYADVLASVDESFGAGAPNSFFQKKQWEARFQSRLARIQGVLTSIEDSYRAHQGLPQLELRLLDVGSEAPISEQEFEGPLLGKVKVESIGSQGDSGIPIFHAWEHIARKAASEQVIYLDADNLIPSNFDWQRYLEGAWFFSKEYRSYSACFAVPRRTLVQFMSRLRESPHLYSWSLRWGGMEDKLAMYGMKLEQAPDVLKYFKNEASRVLQDAFRSAGFIDKSRLFDRYLLEWNRHDDPPPSFTANVNGPLSSPSFRQVLRGYGVWAITDLVLMSETMLTIHFRRGLETVMHYLHHAEDHLPEKLASVAVWRRRWLPDVALIDGSAISLALILLLLACAVTVELCSKIARSLISAKGESDPLMGMKSKSASFNTPYFSNFPAQKPLQPSQPSEHCI